MQRRAARSEHENRRRTDRQDAELILRLMLEGRFPKVWVPSGESRDLRQLSDYRQCARCIYIRHGLEFLNEGFLIRHDFEQGSKVYNMPAFYSQISKEFHRIRPFFRYQYINANQGGFLADIALRHGPSFGARYDFNDFIALKTQFDHTVRKGQPDINGLHMQLASRFESDSYAHETDRRLGRDLARRSSRLFRSRPNICRGGCGRPEEPRHQLKYPRTSQTLCRREACLEWRPARQVIRACSGAYERVVLLKLLGMSESEYKRYWIAQVFRGEAQGEPVPLFSNGMQRGSSYLSRRPRFSQSQGC